MNWNYITGFFDADGSVTLTTPGKGKRKTLQLSFHNNEMAILTSIRNFIEKETGYKGSLACKRARQASHHDSYDLKYSYSAALIIGEHMSSIHPKKAHRIKVYRQIQDITPRNGQYTEEGSIERFKLEEEFWKH
jgi:hypothetical protein